MKDLNACGVRLGQLFCRPAAFTKSGGIQQNDEVRVGQAVPQLGLEIHGRRDGPGIYKDIETTSVQSIVKLVGHSLRVCSLVANKETSCCSQQSERFKNQRNNPTDNFFAHGKGVNSTELFWNFHRNLIQIGNDGDDDDRFVQQHP
ncbi:hypothetical protein D3C85_1492470 [compost metagenome]